MGSLDLISLIRLIPAHLLILRRALVGRGVDRTPLQLGQKLRVLHLHQVHVGLLLTLRTLRWTLVDPVPSNVDIG